MVQIFIVRKIDAILDNISLTVNTYDQQPYLFLDFKRCREVIYWLAGAKQL
jgi:hypothetical protein